MNRLYSDTFGTDVMRAVFSDEGLVRRWLAVEASLARAEAAAGLIPEAAARSIADACAVENIDLDALREGMNLVGYPILPLVRQIGVAAGPAAGGYVHWGATTQDIMDTATSLQIRDARRLMETDMGRIVERLTLLAREHRSTVMAGRTHGQQALPITFGYKLAVYIVELRRHLERLEDVGRRAEFIEFAGAVGSLASVGEAGLAIQLRIADDLGLRVPIIAWHTSRDGIAEFVSVLGLISSTLAKLAQEVALLQRTEIGELEEGYIAGRGGSSTMPQKRNPISSEAIIGASRVVRQLVPVALDAMLHDNERATGPWHAEWLALPEASVLTHGIVRKALDLLEGLVVRPDRMRENLGLTGGLINAEAVMMALAPHLGRQDAHEVVYGASMRTIESKSRFKDELLADPAVARHLSAEAIDRLLAPENYIGLATTIVDHVLDREGAPNRAATAPAPAPSRVSDRS